MELKDLIKKRRLEIGKTLEQVGQEMGVAKATVQRWESGEIKDMRQGKMVALAKALNTTPAYLMGWEDSEPKAPIPGEIPYSPTTRIPILGRIAAGQPLYAEQHIEGYTYIEAPDTGEYFGLIIKGDSMDAARMQEGDLLIVRRQEDVENGEVAVVLVNGCDATVKRFYRNSNTVTLMPQSTNPKHMPQIYDTTKTDIRVQGKVVRVEFRV